MPSLVSGFEYKILMFGLAAAAVYAVVMVAWSFIKKK